MGLAAASQELLIICHEHQSVHRHVSFPSQLLSHRAQFAHMTLLHCEGARTGWGTAAKKKIIEKEG